MKTSPAQNQSRRQICQTVFALTLALAAAGTASANTANWIGVPDTSVSTNWSDNANWNNVGAGSLGPAGNDVFFSGVGSAGSAGIVTSVVDNSLLSPLSLTFTNGPSQFHTVMIPTGVILTNANGFTVGNKTGDGYTTSVSFTGEGTLVQNGSPMTIINLGSANSTALATLDLSTLSAFIYNNSGGTINVANATSGNRFGGLLKLAGVSNNITAGTINFFVNNASNGGNGSSGIQFGTGTNIINVGTFGIVGGKNSGTVQFVSGAPSTAGLKIRGVNGGSDDASRGNMTLAVRTSTGTGTTAGTLNLNGHPVDIKVNTLTIGQDSQSGGNAANGTLSFDTGTFDATTINMSIAGNAAVTGAAATINVGTTANLIVSNMSMANQTAGAGAVGTLNINGGSATFSGNITKTSTAGTGRINITGGFLNIGTNTIGTAANPIDSMTLSSSAQIQLAVNTGIVPIYVKGLTTDGNTGETNVINITSYPAVGNVRTVFTLLQASSTITNTGGTFDFTVTGIPAANTPLVALSSDGTAIQLIINSAASSTNIWTGADVPNGHTNWSDPLNWGAGTVPDANTSVYFSTTASQNASALSAPGGGPGTLVPSKINNIVDTNFTIPFLNYTNIAGTYENTYITGNSTLLVTASGFAAGSSLIDFGNTTNYVTISGPGTLSISNNASVFVGLGDANQGDTPQAVLDMSALNTFNTTVADVLIGVGGLTSGFTVPQSSGIVYLAQTNNITASSTLPDNTDASPVAFEVGDADTLTPVLPSVLYLGVTNRIQADNISVGRQLASGGIYFNPAVISQHPTVTLRGSITNAIASWNIGDGVSNTLTIASSATNDFTGGSVDAVVNTLNIAKASAATYNGGAVTGVLTFSDGNITANTVNLSLNNSNTDGNIYNYGVGTMNISGSGHLSVNANLNMAITVGALAGGTPTATLNVIGGGSVSANSIVAGTNNALSAINLDGATLSVSNAAGTFAAPLTTLNITNSTLNLGTSNSLTTINAMSVNVDGVPGSSNIINILSLPAFASYPTTLKVLQSSNLINLVGGNFNFALGALPNSPITPYAATLGESLDGTAVLLTVTAGPTGARPSITWSGADIPNMNTNWSDATNWVLPGAPLTTDKLIFDGSSTVGDEATINNIVDQNFTVASMTYINASANNWQNTFIPAGNTLTVTGGLSIGTGVVAGANTVVSISGPGELDVNGALAMNGTGGGSDTRLTLDMAGLGTFRNNASTTTMNLGTVAQTLATLNLATNNFINVATLNLETTGGVNGRNGNISLGEGSSVIQANSINIATGKGATCKLQFAANAPDGAVTIGGTGGGSARSAIVLGSGSSGSAVSHGQILLAGHLANVHASTLTMGANGGSDTGTGDDGIVTFDHGTFDVTSIIMGTTTTSAGGKASSGTFTVGGDLGNTATLIVGSAGNGSLVLGNTTTGTDTGSGTLTISNNAIAQINCSITKANAAQNTANLNVIGGVLTMQSGTIGTAVAGIDNLNLDGATLNLNLNGATNVASIYATNVVTTINTNVININAISGLTGTRTFSLLSYSGVDPFAGFTLGAVPAGYAHGDLIDNTTNLSIDLTVTLLAPFTNANILSTTISGTNLVLHGTNNNGGQTFHYAVLTTTNLLTPLANWTILSTNSFSTNGTFDYTNGIDASQPVRYFDVKAVP